MIDALLARIGLPTRPAADLDGLRALHRAYLESVPYEDLAVQLGETAPLDFPELAARLISGRGGYCFELNTVLAGLLRGCGFAVTHHMAVVGGYGPVNHMALLVGVDGETWLADAGLGEGFLDPLPLRAGTYAVGPFTYGLTDEGDTWWMSQHPWGSFSGFRMQTAPSAVADFQAHHRRLATSPESPFVTTLVVQRPRADRITTLRARTLTSLGPAVDTTHVVADRDEFAATLGAFALDVRDEHVHRLWRAACAQHEAFLARDVA